MVFEHEIDDDPDEEPGHGRCPDRSTSTQRWRALVWFWGWVVSFWTATRSKESEEVIELNPAEVKEQGEAANQRDGKRLVKGLLVDSGAGATVAHGEALFPEFPLQPLIAGMPKTTLVGPFGERTECKGTRKVSLRLGDPRGVKAKINVQDAPTRRAILSVGETEAAGDMLIPTRRPL